MKPSSQQVIHWPAAIHFDNDAEMQLVENEASWQQISDSGQESFETGDYLIDSLGQVYTFNQSAEAKVLLTVAEARLSLEDVLGLVKAHLAEQGSCCVAKLYAPSIKDALQMLASEGHCQL